MNAIQIEYRYCLSQNASEGAELMIYASELICFYNLLVKSYLLKKERLAPKNLK